METRSGRLEFSPPQSGPQTVSTLVLFDRPVLSVAVALNGYEAHYDGNDHHVRQFTVDLRAEVGARVDAGWEARVVGTLYLHDNSNARFFGWIDYLLFVELGKRPLPDVGPGHDPGHDPVLEG